jgi:hypothetical protein
MTLRACCCLLLLRQQLVEQQQVMVLLNRAHGAQVQTALIGVIPQAAIKTASAAQKVRGVRNPLLGRFFKRKLDDSTGDIQVIELLFCV